MSRGSRGGFKFDELDCPDGSKLPIKLNREGGEFFIEIEGEDSFRGKDLEDVKRRTLAWLNENRALKWKPMISIEFDERSAGFRSGHKINLEYHRAFVATDSKGKTIVSYFDEITPPGDNETERADLLEGNPGRRDSDWRYRPDEGRVVLDYTPERWSALRLITRAIEDIEAKLRVFLAPKKAEETLGAIAAAGVAKLLGGPTAKKAGVK
jgi:hypothetical protein